MQINRRNIIKAGSLAAGAVLAPTIAGAATNGFDIKASFAGFMKDIGGSAADAGGTVTFTGADPIIRSHFRVGSAMALPAMGAAVGAAAIWRDRTGPGQDLAVDLRESVYNVNPLIGAILLMEQREGTVPAADAIPRDFIIPTSNGLMLQAPVGLGNPMTFVPFETKDGRFFNVTGAYPHLNERALRALKCAPGGENIRRAFKQVNAIEFEEELNAMGGVGVVHRSSEEWLAHPEGKVQAAAPLIEIVKIGSGPPVPWDADPVQPLSGLKVMSHTHVIAGTCSSRTLAEYGAQVLHVARDQAFEHEALVVDVNVGMRSAFVDLRNPDQNKRLKALIPSTDVMVESYRVGAIDRLGFGASEVADGHRAHLSLDQRQQHERSLVQTGRL